MDYSNDPRSSIVTPAITSIEQFPGRIGKEIVDELLKILKGNTNKDAVVATPTVIPAQLVRRMST